ncbi:MAG: nicotinate-nucleotide adenylyltransferase, partial [Lachnospiraceae bacterium]|nr:nicotinate-nucleotide adenylyltransferase [Lachnospiraceae bacterium]
MKIGIMGGTFDPIHYGHLILAETAYDRFGMDKVLIMPAGDPYFKVERGVSADEDREAMTRLAIEGNPHFEFSDLELKREGDTYTVDTLKILKEQYPYDDLYLIVGSDTLFQMEKWYKPQEIFQMATILSSRRNIPNAELEEQMDYLRSKFGAKIVNLYMPNIDISS